MRMLRTSSVMNDITAYARDGKACTAEASNSGGETGILSTIVQTISLIFDLRGDSSLVPLLRTNAGPTLDDVLYTFHR